MTKGLVSIVTPCHNGEGYLGRFLDSVLAQTYPHVELFLINDGSTDKTEEIALGYRDAFVQRGHAYTYIRQENGGQASAVNRGLTLFKANILLGLTLTIPSHLMPLPSKPRSLMHILNMAAVSAA